ncbi:Rv3235 family protein [Promicromonospora sp. Marseille-Q5078]
MTATTTATTTPAPVVPGPSVPATPTPPPAAADAAAAPARAGDEDESAQPVGAPPRHALRVSATPRPTGPAGYPEASTRPGPRVRRVRVGTPGARRPSADEEDATTRPLREATPAPLPDPTAQCCAVVRAAVEVLRGERPAGQLARWVTPQVRDQLAERARIGLAHDGLRGAEHHLPVQVRRVRLVRLGEDVAEATVVLDDDGRVRAAAVRLEARRGAWRVAVLEIG